MSKKTLAHFGKVIREARLIIGLSQEELALESGLDRTYISMIERGVKVPTLSTLVKLSDPLFQSPAQLLFRAQQFDEVGFIGKTKKNAGISLYGTAVSCGKPLFEDFSVEKVLSLDELMIKNPAETFFVKASGDSMSPSIWDKDILVVSRTARLKNGSIVLVQIYNEFSVKRYFRTNKGIRLLPDNQNFHEIIVSKESNLLICGVVIGSTRIFS